MPFIRGIIWPWYIYVDSRASPVTCFFKDALCLLTLPSFLAAHFVHPQHHSSTDSLSFVPVKSESGTGQCSLDSCMALSDVIMQHLWDYIHQTQGDDHLNPARRAWTHQFQHNKPFCLSTMLSHWANRILTRCPERRCHSILACPPPPSS